MERIILFITHWQTTENWNYIIEELKRYWKVFVLVDEIQKSKIKWVTYSKYKNEWYDFGKIYQFILSYKWEIDELIYTNDTISIIDSFKCLFDWWSNSNLDMWWATSAYSSDSKKTYWYHLQSFFHFFRWDTIKYLYDRYMSKWIIRDKFDWVKYYETLLTEYIVQKWLKVWAYLEIDVLSRKHWWYRYDTEIFQHTNQRIYKVDWELNWSFEYPTTYIEEWLPFIKNSCMQYHMYDETLLPKLTNMVLAINIDNDNRKNSDISNKRNNKAKGNK